MTSKSSLPSDSLQSGFDVVARPAAPFGVEVLDPYRQEDGAYRFRLTVKTAGDSVMVSSPDLKAFAISVGSESGLVGVELISNTVKTAMAFQYGMQVDQVLFSRQGGKEVVHGADAFIGLAAADNYEMIVVDSAVSSSARFTKLPQKPGRGEKAVLRTYL